MFDFEYKIECYTPAPLRHYGYFTLPILRRGALVGRLDAKAHRKEGIFEIKTLHLEPGVRVDDEMINDIAGAIREISPLGTRHRRATCTLLIRRALPHVCAKLSIASSNNPR